MRAARAELVGLDLADLSMAEENGEQWGKLTVAWQGQQGAEPPVAGGALAALQDG